MGAGFSAVNNSQHTWRGIHSFKSKPGRFDEMYNSRDAEKPAPTSYSP